MLEGVFVPTGTTKVLAEAVYSYVSKPGKLLDLGCGSGAVGITLHKMGVVEAPLYASDISEEAVGCTKKNAFSNDCTVIAKCGSLFDPWQNDRFDYIVDDVAGIAQEVAQNSPWYANVSCESGADGTFLVCEIIREASNYLNPGGLFFFPAISLSDCNAILSAAHNNFSHVKQLSHTEWPLPKEMYVHLEMLERLKKQRFVDFIDKFGMVVCCKDIYVAYK